MPISPRAARGRANLAAALQRTPRERAVVLVLLLALVLAGLAASPAAAATATITGVVFEDRDGDGVQSRTERGLRGVTVSDGATLAVTGPGGDYTIDVDPDRRHTDLVFVTVPAGWSAGVDEHMLPRFFRHVDLADGEARADFALARDRDGHRRDFSAIGLADVHVQAGTTNNRIRFSDQIAQINELVAGARSGRRDSDAPSFVTVAGDLTNDATLAEFDDYLAATATSLLPVWPAIGNHEYFYQAGSAYRDLVDNYRQKVGPEWYSFDHGDRHFVVLDNIQGLAQPEMLDWLAADLAANATGKQVVVTTHIPLNTPQATNGEVIPELVALLEQYDTRLVLSGHTHSNDVSDEVVEGAKYVTTTSASYTIDQVPNGFRVLHFPGDGGTPTVPVRDFERQRHITLVHPAPGARVPQAPTTLQVNAYSTSHIVESARARVDGDRRWTRLEPSGSRTWAAPWDASDLALGEHEVTVEVTDHAGDTWTQRGTFTVVPAGTVATPTAGDPWEAFHGDAAHTGTTADALSPELGLAWSSRTGGSILTSSPAVVGDGAYVGIRDENDTEHNSVLAVDLATGEERWRVDTEAQVVASPSVADGVVFAGTIRGVLHALDAETGEELWQRRFGPERFVRAWMYQSATVVDGVVYQAYNTRDQGAKLAALDAATGEVLWENPGSLGSSWITHSSPAVDGDHVFAVAGGTISAIDRADGSVEWQTTPAGGWMRGQPVVAEGHVLFNYQGDQLVAVDAETGAVAWRYRSPDASYLYGGGTASVPAVADGVAYVGFADGNVTALDLATGTPRWSHRTEHAVISSPALSGDTLYVGSNDGHVYGLDAATGQPLWSYDLGVWVASSPAVSGNAVVVGAWDGNLYAFTPDGSAPTPRWPQVRFTGTVTDAEGAPVEGARVAISQVDGERRVEARTRADGTYDAVVADPAAAVGGTFDVVVSKRGHAPATTSAEATEDGQTVVVDATIAAYDAPVAGVTDLVPDLSPTSGHTVDVVPGDTYHHVTNGVAQAIVSSREGANNQAGTFRAGWLSDFARHDGGVESLDWTEWVLTTRQPGAPDWNRPGEWLPLPDVRVEGDTVVASGTPVIDDDLAAEVTYRMLPGAPVVKMTLSLTNTGSEDFAGFFKYSMDPDSPSDVAVVPGVGANPGYVSQGWTANYVYDGPQSAADTPAHAIAWVDDEPHTLMAAGYVFGGWWDASVAAGETTELSWYHITDAPAAGADPTATIASWAARLDLLDDEVADRSRVSGTVTAAATGEPLAGVRVEVRDTDGDVVTSAVSAADGTYTAPVGAGDYTVSATRLGYDRVGVPVTVGDGATATADIVLPVVRAAAGTGKVLSGGLVEGRATDVVLENDRLAVSISTGSNDGQLDGVTAGKVRDAAPHGVPDGGLPDEIDWLNLPYFATTQPTGPEAWQSLTVRSDEVTVIEAGGDRAVVRATGAVVGQPDLTVTTDYTIEPGEDWVEVETVVANAGSTPVTGWIGDAIDNDGGGQRSGVAGHEAITTPYGSPAAYDPAGPWIGMAGSGAQVVGFVYDDADFTAYGNGNWIQSQRQVTVPAGGEVVLSRRLVVARADGDPFATLAAIAADGG